MDIDDLLESSEPTGQHQLSNKKSWTAITKSKLAGTTDDDLFDEELFNWGGPSKKPAANKNPSTQTKPYQLPKSNDDDEWGMPDNKVVQPRPSNISFQGSNWKPKVEEDDLDAMLNDIDGGNKQKNQPTTNTKQSTFANSKTNSYNNPQKQEDDGWGDVVPSKSTALTKPVTSRGKSANPDDLLDNLLDDFEEKKGISTTKQQQRPKTSNQPLWSAQRNNNKDDDLDQLDDNFGAGSGQGSFIKSSDVHQRSNDEILQKKKSLFGVTATQNNHSGDLGNKQQLQRPTTASGGQPVQQQFQATTMSGQGSVDSGIDIIETGFSRRKQIKRPPTASGAQQPPQGSAGQTMQSSGQDFNRPHTGPINNIQKKQPVYHDSDENFNQQSQGSFEKPLQINVGNFNFQTRTNFNQSEIGDDNEFERAPTELDETEEHSSYEEDATNGFKGSDTDDSESEGLYMPTLIGKQKSDKPVSKKKKKKPVAKSNKKQPVVQSKPSKSGLPQRSPDSARGGSYQTPLILDNNRKQSQTMSGNESHDMIVPNVGAGNPANNSNAAANLLNQFTSTFSDQKALQSLNENQILQLEIEQEKKKIKLVEDSNRKELDQMRQDHQKHLNQMQTDLQTKITQIEKDKAHLVEQRTRTIELEKNKLSQLHKMDTEQLKIVHERAVQALRQVYEQEHDHLRMQLQQQSQMNSLAEEISKSSGNINSLVHKLSSQQEGELLKREQQIEQRDSALADKKRSLADRKQQLELRRKKLQIEFQEVSHLEREAKNEFEAEKREIKADIDRREIESQQEQRLIKNTTIDLDVETKRVIADVARVEGLRKKEVQLGNEKMEDMNIELKSIEQQKVAFRKDMEATERELRQKLKAVEDLSRELLVKENQLAQQVREFQELEKQSNQENESLQEQIERLNIERDAFDRKAMAVKEQGEQDQLDSEKIGFFKANKDRIREELTQVKKVLDDEKLSLQDDRIKLQIFTQELKFREKAIEAMRYEYIKATSGDVRQFSNQANELNNYKLMRKEQAEEQRLYPIAAFEKASPPAPAASRTQVYGQGAFHPPPNQSGKFNYDDYMKTLKSKLELSAPNTGSLSGNSFQQFIIKERQDYLRSVDQYSQNHM